MKRYCFSIILGLFTSILVFAQFTSEDIATDEFVTEERPVTIPVFNPESDRFFGTEFQNAFIRGKSREFYFVSLYLDIFKIPDDLLPQELSDNVDSIIRYSGALGGMRPIGDYLSVMGGFGVVRDYIYFAEAWNLFIGAGVFGHYDPWGIGLGILGGFYQNRYRELPLGNDGFYHGNIEDQPEDITRSARFMIIPRVFLSDKVFFLDELSANIGFSEKIDALKILSRLAFSAIQIGAAKLNIDIYYNQFKYNMLLDQRSFGAQFDSKYLSLDIGYRQFLNTADTPFISHYKDGILGRIIAKIWILEDKNGKHPLLISYGFEHTFEMRHFFGIGFQFGRNRMTMDSIMELSTVGDMRWGAIAPYE